MRALSERKRKGLKRAAVLGALVLGSALPAQSVAAEEGVSYAGITIDGDFSDWDGVQKYPAANGVNQVAFVFDGDYMYVYIDEPTQAFSATWSGTHGNGKFTIITDLGYETLFQLTSENNGTVAGVDGALCAHSDTTWGLDGYYWELAIPAGNLQPYNETVSFGHYLADSMYVSDVANIAGSTSQGSAGQEESGGTENGEENNDVENGGEEQQGGSFTGIIYDGSYDDWTYYPHTLIEYATAGTHETVPDGEAALYSVDGILYGHVQTCMPAHLQEAGGELTQAVTIRVNGSMDFYPQMITVDGSGNINYSPQLSGLPQGTYEFWIIDATGGKNATNIAQWTDPAASYIYGTNAVYGRAMVTVGASRDDMEYFIDIPTLAAKFGIDANSAQTLAAQYGRIGQQWTQTAGTSTGAALGLALCAGVVGCSLIRKKRMEAKGTV